MCWNEALYLAADRARKHKPTGCTEVHTTRQVASQVAERPGQCHQEDAVYYGGKTMVIMEASCLLDEVKFQTRCQEGQDRRI